MLLSRTAPPAPARARLDDAEVARLVRCAGAGDQRAWEALVAEFGGMIFAIARGARLGEADAAEVSQATWTKLLERLDTLNDPARVGAWLATTARRECLRILRGAQRQIPYGDDVPERETTELAAGERLLLAERDAALWRSFARLRSSDQALLRMLMAEPRPAYEDIAAALDMPIGSIGPTRARALERLRAELDRDGALAA